jgi:hypothetical protein
MPSLLGEIIGAMQQKGLDIGLGHPYNWFCAVQH